MGSALGKEPQAHWAGGEEGEEEVGDREAVNRVAPVRAATGRSCFSIRGERGGWVEGGG